MESNWRPLHFTHHTEIEIRSHCVPLSEFMRETLCNRRYRFVSSFKTMSSAFTITGPGHTERLALPHEQWSHCGGELFLRFGSVFR